MALRLRHGRAIILVLGPTLMQEVKDRSLHQFLFLILLWRLLNRNRQFIINPGCRSLGIQLTMLLLGQTLLLTSFGIRIIISIWAHLVTIEKLMIADILFE